MSSALDPVVDGIDPADIVRHHPFVPDAVEWIVAPQVEEIEVAEPDAQWPQHYGAVAARIRAALGDRVLGLEHVGSTAVPGLPAKPVVDIDLTLADPRDEEAYVPDLAGLGLAHVLREPAWFEHRAFRRPIGPDGPRVNLHVWGPRCPEVARHLLLRDWLRAHPEDRALYAEAKRSAARVTNAADGGRGGVVMDYNQVKEPVVREILDRVFRAHGLASGTIAG